MKKFIFTLATMLSGIVPTLAQNIAEIPDNSIYTSDATANPGRQFVLSFQLKNSADVEAVGLHFHLPEGFSIARNDGGDRVYAMNAGRDDSHSLRVSGPHPAGEYRASVLNTKSYGALVGHEGEIFNVTLEAAETLAYGNYEVRLEQVELSCLGKIVSQDGTYTGKITVAAPTAVSEAAANAAASEVEIYGTNGIRQSALRSGINIVKGVNGGKARAVSVK